MRKRRFVAGLLCMITLLFGSVPTMAASSKSVTYTQANEICTYVYQGYNEGTKGPIIITKGTLTKGSSTRTIYLVTLSGTEMVTNQSTGYLTDLLVGFNLNNAYLSNAVKAITSTVPKNSNLILSGHSLGGMVAQQIAANTTIKNNYNVLNTVTFGSPLISAGSREGTVKRLGDTSDVVPYLSATGQIIWQVAGLNRENGGYGTDAYNAHVGSYLRSDVWGKYDVLGYKNGSASITLDLSTQTYFKSPTNY